MSVSETYATNIDAAIAAYSDMVYKIALARTGNRNDAGDVFQEVFLRLVKHKNKITSDEHLKRWLIRVAINCCKTSFLKWKNARFVETDVSEHGTWLLPEESDVYLAVHRLPPKYRDVIHLFYYEDLSVKEISEILRVKEPTIKSQLSRARDKLRIILKEPIDAAAGGI